MGRRHPVRTVFNYAVCIGGLFLAYKFFQQNDSQKTDPFRGGASKDHPKHNPKLVKPRPLDRQEEAGLPGLRDNPNEETDNLVDKIDHVQVDVGDIPKDADQDDDSLASLSQDEKRKLPIQQKRFNNPDLGQPETAEKRQNKTKTFFLPGEVDWELEEEMKKRRAEFFRNVDAAEEKFEPDEYMNLVETHDDITFVTAGSHSMYHATLQFIYSVQYFYPDHNVVIYDIGLTSEEKAFIGSLCQTTLDTLLVKLWPENLYKIRHRIWRPFLLQFALVKYGHCVYVEPGRVIDRQLIMGYLEKSRIHGVVMGGKQLKHSTYYVTSPHMYSFLATNEDRLKKTPHLKMTLIVLHNTKRVQHHLMRYLMSCTMEEYCISPPGAQPNCDPYLGAGQKYGRCHWYDESALNLILNKWHNYKTDEYFMRDLLTAHYSDSDVMDKLSVCNDGQKEEV